MTANIADQCLRCKKLEAVLLAVDANMGIYPAAVRGYNDARDYEERNGFKNGWNACITDYGDAFCRAVAEAQVITDTDAVFLAEPNLFQYEEGAWSVFLNDTWYYASADGESIPKDKEQEVCDLFRRFGRDGVLYWVYTQRGHYPDISDTKKDVQRVERKI